MIKGLILACGDGSRLAPFTNDNSKALVPYMGKTGIYYVCEEFLRWGITDIYLFYDKGIEEKIRIEIQDLDIILTCVHLKKGWNNTWSKACELFADDTVVVINCDTMLSEEYKETITQHLKMNADISMACSTALPINGGQVGKLAFIEEENNLLTSHSIQYRPKCNIVREVGLSVIGKNGWHLIKHQNLSGENPWFEEILPNAIKNRLLVQCVRIDSSFQDIGTWPGIYRSYFQPLAKFEHNIMKNCSNRFDLQCEHDYSSEEMTNCVIMRQSRVENVKGLNKAVVLPLDTVKTNESVIIQLEQDKFLYDYIDEKQVEMRSKLGYIDVKIYMDDSNTINLEFVNKLADDTISIGQKEMPDLLDKCYEISDFLLVNRVCNITIKQNCYVLLKSLLVNVSQIIESELNQVIKVNIDVSLN